MSETRKRLMPNLFGQYHT